jgi:hypothetical protein
MTARTMNADAATPKSTRHPPVDFHQELTRD